MRADCDDQSGMTFEGVKKSGPKGVFAKLLEYLIP